MLTVPRTPQRLPQRRYGRGSSRRRSDEGPPRTLEKFRVVPAISAVRRPSPSGNLPGSEARQAVLPLEAGIPVAARDLEQAHPANALRRPPRRPGVREPAAGRRGLAMPATKGLPSRWGRCRDGGWWADKKERGHEAAWPASARRPGQPRLHRRPAERAVAHRLSRSGAPRGQTDQCAIKDVSSNRTVGTSSATHMKAG